MKKYSALSRQVTALERGRWTTYVYHRAFGEICDFFNKKEQERIRHYIEVVTDEVLNELGIDITEIGSWDTLYRRVKNKMFYNGNYKEPQV